MTIFTIDEQNNITAFGLQEEAARATGLAFSSQKELAKLTTEWPVGRFVDIWNGFAGVAPFSELKPVKKFTDRKTAVARIWQAIQRLSADAASSSFTEEEMRPETEAAITDQGPEIAPDPVSEVPTEVATEIEQPAPEATAEVASVPEVAVAAEVAAVAPQVSDVAPEVVTGITDASPIENTPAADAVSETASTEQTATKQPKRKKASKPVQNSTAPRETKLSQVVAMLQRPEGAKISEIMTTMGWQRHTVRGFVAGAMKKAGYNVDSFKPEGGERSYRILPK
jgi:hypothetical protein